MQNTTGTQLLEAWGSLLALLRESIIFSPSAQFLLIAVLHELMIKCCPLPDRKDQKDLQDVTSKVLFIILFHICIMACILYLYFQLIESISTVCGSCLEQTTWLRRNLAVKEEVENDNASISSKSGSFQDPVFSQTYSVQAQLVSD